MRMGTLSILAFEIGRFCGQHGIWVEACLIFAVTGSMGR